MRFVPLKTQDQLDLQALHRVRDRLVSHRTAVINRIPGVPTGTGDRLSPWPEVPVAAHALILEDAELDLFPLLRQLLDQLWQEWKALTSQSETTSQQIERIADEDAACQRLQQIPGVGPLVATAMVAAIGNGSAFVKGREFAALGLVPRQYSTGGKAKLLGISKRQSVSQALVHPWSTKRADTGQTRPSGFRHLDASTGTTDAPQRRGGRSGQQVGADCLGGAGQGGELSLASTVLCRGSGTTTSGMT
jgi:hypothetical protein